MQRSASRRRVGWGLAVCLGLASGSSPAAAQDVGDRVRPLKTVALKVKDEIIAEASPREELVVERVNGDWLWVQTPDKEFGWVLKEDVELAAGTPAAAPDAPAAPEAGARDPLPAAPPVDDRLYLIGAMGATQVYLTYAYIGAVGDGFVKETYDAEQTRTLMNEVRGMTEHLVTQLQKVRGGELSADDQRALDEMIQINEQLKQLAAALVTYADGPTPETADGFEKIRKSVWPRIAALLGIPESPEESTETDAAPAEAVEPPAP